MDTAVLVDRHIEDGRILIQELLKRKWKIGAAFWNEDKESNEWKLFISLSLLKQEGSRSIYLRLSKTIKEIQPKLTFGIADIRLIESNHDVVRSIRESMHDDRQNDRYTKSMVVTGDPKIAGKTIYYILMNMKI